VAARSDRHLARAQVEATMRIVAEAHRTRRGSRIEAKRWIVVYVNPPAKGTKGVRRFESPGV
jgi:hypothetical protein